MPQRGLRNWNETRRGEHPHARSSVAINVPAWMDAERGACLGASAVERASVYSSVAPVGNEGRLEGAVVSTGMHGAPW